MTPREERGWGPPGKTEAGVPPRRTEARVPQEDCGAPRLPSTRPGRPSTACFSNLSDLTEHERWPGHAAPAVRTPRRGTQPRSRRGCTSGRGHSCSRALWVPGQLLPQTTGQRVSRKTQPVSVTLPEGREEGVQNPASQPGREWPWAEGTGRTSR